MSCDSQDFYNSLGVDKSASQDEIKKAYRKMALKWHPDKNKLPNASDMFKQINEAYDTLNDPEKRKIYDQFGREGLNSRGMKFEGENAFDIFSRVFGDQGFFGMPNIFQGMHMFHEQQNKERLDIILCEQITLKDVYNGKKTTVNLQRKIQCNSCNGTGFSDKIDHTCKKCNGKKFVQIQTNIGNMISISQQHCTSCNGIGNDGCKNLCQKCNGLKFQPVNEPYAINIPVGLVDSDILKFKNMGNFDPISRKIGDLLVKISVQHHDKFLRNVTINNKLKIENNDLAMQLEITLAEALCGVNKTFKNPNNDDIMISISDVIKNNDLYVVENCGLPKRNGGFGNLYVFFNVVFPVIPIERKCQLWKILVGTNYVEPQMCKLNLHKIDV